MISQTGSNTSEPDISQTVVAASDNSSLSEATAPATRSRLRVKQSFRQNRLVIIAAGALVVAFLLFVAVSVPRQSTPKQSMTSSTTGVLKPQDPPAEEHSLLPITDPRPTKPELKAENIIDEETVERTAKRSSAPSKPEGPSPAIQKQTLASVPPFPETWQAPPYSPPPAVNRETSEKPARNDFQMSVLNSNTKHLPHPSQVFHALELNTIQLALARANLLATWQSELEIASFNTMAQRPFAKDYDAIVDVWLGSARARFAVEYERTLKNNKEYDQIRAALEQERQLGCILYLGSGPEMLVHLIRKVRSVHNNVVFAPAAAFEKGLLDTIVTVAEGVYERLGDLLLG